MTNSSSPTYYADYLRLSQLLACQQPLSGDGHKPAHDEMLFIIVHQAYELWFKLCLFELDSVLETFGQDSVDEKQVGIAVSRLQRIIEIQNLLIEQLRVLETMTALDFLDFRDVLYPASGFQSFQFRLLENKLGMLPDQRLLYNREVYYSHLAPDHQRLIQQSEKGPSLFALVERWLERTPFVDFHGFDFWRVYRQAVEDMLAVDRKAILANTHSSQTEKESQLREVDTNQENFEAILNEDKHRSLIDRGLRRLSHRATKAALLIELYRDEPILHMPFQLLTALMDIDEQFNAWRYRHALMVQRMIGNKIGTGGSTGYSYLRATIDKYKIFADLFNLSTFLIPRSRLPELPEEVKKNLGFYYSRRDS